MLTMFPNAAGRICGSLIVGAALACSAGAAMALDARSVPVAGQGMIRVAQMTPAQEDNFNKAMQLLRPSGDAKPSREDVDRAGHMLMEAGPDAFERAMNLLRMPNVKSADVNAAKQDMMKGGANASDKAMNLLRKAYDY